MHHRTAVGGRDLDGGVHAAGGGAADQQRQVEALALHLGGEPAHLVEARRDQPRDPDQVRLLLARSVEDLRRRHHDAEVDDLEVVAAQDDAHDVLADVVDIALDRGGDDLARGLGHPPARPFLLLDEGHEMGDRLLHHAGALDHLRQEHLAGTEQVADHVHAVHQRPLDHIERAVGCLPRLFGVVDDVIGDAVHQRVAEPAVHILLAPGVRVLVPRGTGTRVAVALGDLEQALGGVGPAVEQHVLDRGPERLGEVLVDRELAGIDDPHVHAGAGGVIEERRVHRLADGVVPAERERDVRNPARDMDVRPSRLDPARGLDEGAGVVVVLGDAGGDGEDVGVEDDVGRQRARCAR